MKKLILAGLATVCFIQSTMFYAENTYVAAKSEIITGDIDGNDIVDLSDATLILNAYAESAAGLNVDLTEQQKQAADVDNDGDITISDATYVIAYCSRDLAGLSVDWESITYNSEGITTTATTINSNVKYIVFILILIAIFLIIFGASYFKMKLTYEKVNKNVFLISTGIAIIGSFTISVMSQLTLQLIPTKPNIIPTTSSIDLHETIKIEPTLSLFKIYYTTNGNSPKNNGIFYEGEFKVPIEDIKNNNITISAQMKFLFFDVGDMETKEYTIK